MSGRPDPGRSGAGWARTRRGQPRVPQPIPARLPPPLLFILASFLPSFQSVELLSRQVRSRSRSRGRLRKTSIALKGVLLAVMLAEGRSLRIAARRGWVAGWGVCAPGIRTSQLGWKPRARGEREVRVCVCGGGWGGVAFRAEFCTVLGGCPLWFFQLSASASALAAPLGVESQVRTRGGRRTAGVGWGGVGVLTRRKAPRE